MKLVFPTPEYKEKATEYIGEFYEYNSEINGSGALDRFLQESTYEEWLVKVRKDIDIANVEKPRVPTLTYFYVREEDDRIVGMINIRLALNDFLREEGGHIGYSVRPTERRKHYATDMLKAGVEVLNTIGINEVLVSCDKENLASSGTILNNGGRLIKEKYSETFQEMIQMYSITK
ncbi:MAG: GNAT family N-acetyltransferase [Lachnospiraceae bacterium]|nr:GNAT family N-acetyltransferase [Lachnospiraceae bacterium]